MRVKIAVFESSFICDFRLSLAPPVAEALLGNCRQIATPGPRAEARHRRDHAICLEWSLAQPRQLVRPAQPGFTLKNSAHHLHAKVFLAELATYATLLALYQFGTKVNQDLGNVDLHRARFIAGAAQR